MSKIIGIDTIPKNSSDVTFIKEIASLTFFEVIFPFFFSIIINNKFVEKRNERIKLLGEEQAKEIEKRIFLQLIDQNWKMHIQYLEQLRQVIGLRSYGQKDPLAEFRREAFQLFESLLFKIKVETIKFLINTNIVVEEKNEQIQKNNLVKKRKVSRNEPCTCGSGKKYKHCCGRAA